MAFPLPKQNGKPVLGNVLVIGGCGFLGHHIVNTLLESYSSQISVLDLYTTRNRRPASDGVQYFDGDITSMESLLPIFEKTRPDVVIHTASPVAVADASKKTKELYYKVNVEGTKCVIEACQKTGVKALVYTSSASVVSDNESDLINVDESWPVVPPKYQTEYYGQTKAEAESLVIKANRSPLSPTLQTISLRPAGIFGEGDVQNIPNIVNAYLTGKSGFQLGDNTNIFEFTYVGNVAHSHGLAAEALLYAHAVGPPIEASRRCDGEVFFITNDEPIYFWDYARAIYKAAGNEKGTEHVWVISKDVGLLIGSILEWGNWVLGRKPKLTIRQVKFSCMTRYYDCSKAKKRLAYKPPFKLSDGIKRSVKYHLEELEAAKLKEGIAEK